MNAESQPGVCDLFVINYPKKKSQGEKGEKYKFSDINIHYQSFFSAI
jgi:hypothetical protein